MKTYPMNTLAGILQYMGRLSAFEKRSKEANFLVGPSFPVTQEENFGTENARPKKTLPEILAQMKRLDQFERRSARAKGKPVGVEAKD
jgi:hypothetical protein